MLMSGQEEGEGRPTNQRDISSTLSPSSSGVSFVLLLVISRRMGEAFFHGRHKVGASVGPHVRTAAQKKERLTATQFQIPPLYYLVLLPRRSQKKIITK